MTTCIEDTTWIQHVWGMSVLVVSTDSATYLYFGTHAPRYITAELE